ncbi:ParB family chromosome partitioning protein OS=Castellaniella defragrans OX=75697 GN=HNR28_002413 PE=4 SV=1 [Castellaniella defragrans]
MSLSAVMAFAITDDQDRQREQWVRMDRWDRKNTQPSGIRQCLMDEAWTADHALAKYVGLDAYEAAGGRMTRDCLLRMAICGASNCTTRTS